MKYKSQNISNHLIFLFIHEESTRYHQYSYAESSRQYQEEWDKNSNGIAHFSVGKNHREGTRARGRKDRRAVDTCNLLRVFLTTAPVCLICFDTFDLRQGFLTTARGKSQARKSKDLPSHVL